MQYVGFCGQALQIAIKAKSIREISGLASEPEKRSLRLLGVVAVAPAGTVQYVRVVLDDPSRTNPKELVSR